MIDPEILKVWVPVGGLLLTGIYYFFRIKSSKSKPPQAPQSPTINVTQNNNNNSASSYPKDPENPPVLIKTPLKDKASVSILFVDDDTKFRVVNILKQHGYTNTKILKDIQSLDQPEVKNADIFFVDIQGVGKHLSFKDQGLGLVAALKKRYSEKKVVIYSAEQGANAFHAAFRECDDRLTKDADPYEFIVAVERLSA